MEETRQTREHGAAGDGRAVLLCHDGDTEQLARLVGMGGRIVGWVDGFYRVQIGAGNGR